jgi:DNA-binding GntR family transcriptional regulator
MTDIRKGSTPIRLPGLRPIALELYEELRNSILNGVIAPNERVTEETIAAWAGVSRTPVREAMHHLEVDGLLRTSAHGTTVVEFSVDELMETCTVRDTLEGLAARLAASYGTDFDFAMLEELTREFEAAIGGDLTKIIQLNHEFHDFVWKMARNSYLKRQLSLVRALIERRDSTTLTTQERQREVCSEHRAILTALVARDPEGANDAALLHFRQASARRVLARSTSIRMERRL